MKIISQKIKIKEFVQNKKKLGFVPTMGGIHDGHISLIKRSIRECDNTVVSIFVNKQQFNNKNDFARYPRNIKNDIKRLNKLKIDMLYLPRHKEIYIKGYNKNIKINPFRKKLCGKFRPGHFEGVVDVVDRFIKIINPMRVYFGEKDFQQLKILEDFIKKNHPKCRVVSCKTLREKNGVPFSSRNFLLNCGERKVASKIFKLIKNSKKKLILKVISIKKIKNIISALGVKKIDYIKILDINKIIKPHQKKNKYKIFLAYYIGKTRLIDNI